MVPNGLTTLILLAVMALQTAALEQANAPISDSYFLLVVPKKLSKTMFVIVNGDVALSVALVNLNGVVHIINEEGVIGDVVDSTGSATSLEVAADS